LPIKTTLTLTDDHGTHTALLTNSGGGGITEWVGCYSLSITGATTALGCSHPVTVTTAVAFRITSGGNVTINWPGCDTVTCHPTNGTCPRPLPGGFTNECNTGVTGTTPSSLTCVPFSGTWTMPSNQLGITFITVSE
jgi:hypothetical protein